MSKRKQCDRCRRYWHADEQFVRVETGGVSMAVVADVCPLCVAEDRIAELEQKLLPRWLLDPVARMTRRHVCRTVDACNECPTYDFHCRLCVDEVEGDALRARVAELEADAEIHARNSAWYQEHLAVANLGSAVTICGVLELLCRVIWPQPSPLTSERAIVRAQAAWVSVADEDES